MNRNTIEKEQLVKKFEEIIPMLKNVKKFGWYIPECDADPVFTIYSDYTEPEKIPFARITVNVKTGWHSEYIYRDDRGSHRVREGIVPVNPNDWSDYCWRSNCVCKQEDN